MELLLLEFINKSKENYYFDDYEEFFLQVFAHFEL
jgi:hypothetical protein